MRMKSSPIRMWILTYLTTPMSTAEPTTGPLTTIKKRTFLKIYICTYIYLRKEANSLQLKIFNRFIVFYLIVYIYCPFDEFVFVYLKY